jgi:hypothetical protein
LWERWKVIAHVIGTFNAKVMLTVLYHVLLPTFALIARSAADRLLLRRDAGPAWRVRPLHFPTLEDGRRQSS